jgi:hypothetical protein
MSIFDGILGNIEGMAEKFGIPADQLQSLVSAAQEKLANGGDLSSLMQMAQDHGLSMDKLQEMMGGAGADGLLGKAQDMLGGGDLGGMVKGLFGKD